MSIIIRIFERFIGCVRIVRTSPLIGFLDRALGGDLFLAETFIRRGMSVLSFGHDLTDMPICL